MLRRVLRAEELSAGDIEELTEPAVAELEQQVSPFAALNIADFPSIAALEEGRVLVGIRDLHNVNALRSDQSLTFGPQLTVIYGDNGSGKSGYGRVLKKVYRARVVEEILGDVCADTPSADLPRANFALRAADGAELTVTWEEGSPASNVGRFAVLDSACSATYVRGGALAVGPAGIDVPRRFAEALDKVKRHLGRLAAAALPNKKALQILENDTAAGQFIRGLSSATTDAAVATIATWTSDDARAAEDLGRAIAEARAQATSARRSQLQARLKALHSVGKRLAQWTAAVAQSQVQEISTAFALLAHANVALHSVETLDDSEVSEGLLKGNVWLDLLVAASRFVESLDPERHALGPMSADGRCALCWQPLGATAQARMVRFKGHLEGTALKNRQAAAKRLDTLLAIVRSVPDALTAEDEALLAAEAGLPEQIRALMNALRLRRDVILGLADDGATARSNDALPELDETPLSLLRQLYARAQRQLLALPSSDSEAEQHIRRLEQALLELTTRRALYKSVEQVRDFISGTRAHQRLRNAETAINTRAASSQAAALHAKHMTERYSVLVNDELRGLRFRRRRPTLVQKTSKARVEVTPLVSSELKHIPAERVFSEGERTAIALACFLAELRLGDDSSGLIFDDPVSSLDHNVREHVARRLVAAAKERQVIVFTHDLAFLADLREQAKKIQSVGCEFRTLVATDYAAGFVENEEPFGARTVKKRLGALKQLVVTAERVAKNGDVHAVRIHARDFYERLRSTWERFIEERLFAAVVQRLERNVTPGALSRVAYSKELAEQVHEGWRRCSNAIEAHDHAPAAGGRTYSVEEMKADLQLLIEADKAAPAQA